MKKIFLTGLMIFSLVLSGCTGENSSTPPAEKKAVVETVSNGEETDKPETEDKTTSKPPTEQKAESGDDSANKPAGNGVGEPNRNSGNNPATNPAPPAEDEKNPPTEKNAEAANPIAAFVSENPLMAGIIVALILLTLVLIWLIYDRRKMKDRLNNINKPSRPIEQPPPQSAMTIIEPTNSSLPMSVGGMNIRVGNLQHIGARKEQQDSFCMSNIGDRAAAGKGVLAVVADGMGGLEGGAQISRIVTETFLESYNNQSDFDPATFLYNTAEKSEYAVEDYISRTGVNGGSTVVAVLVKNSLMNYVSVGDSHIYLLRGNVLQLINREHNFAALLKEKADRGEVDKSEPYVNPKRHALTAYIGVGNFNMVDMNTAPIPLMIGDKILLCSDGVYNALGDDALIAAMAGDAASAAARIQQEILAQAIPTQDNFTAIILEYVAN